MLRTLNGGPAGGEVVEMDASYDYDFGSRIARYEVQSYSFEGQTEDIAVFVGFVAKPS